MKALGLCSGGLDSILSALVLRDQGIEVQWVTFETPFFSSAKAREAAAMTGVPLRVEGITGVYLKMLRNPKLGYGRYMNPCPDCHALMFRLAGEMLAEEGASFLFSGEVAGQRPMSQNKNALRYVEKNSGYDGLIVRPLSGKILPPTVPEKEGWINRDLLLDFSGRGRKPQMALAEHYGITSYPNPAGGCLLTDEGFSRRLKDLFAHAEETPERDLMLLSHGRHYRLDARTKAVAGRDKKDNEAILALHDPSRDILLTLEGIPGPKVLIPGGGTAEAVALGARLCAAHGRARDRAVRVRVEGAGTRTVVEAYGVMDAELEGKRM